MEEMEILPEFQKAMAYVTKLGLIGSLQNEMGVLSTCVEETLR